MNKGYTNATEIEENLGRQLTVTELDKVDRLMEVAEHFIDDWCGRSWSGNTTITDELYGIEERMQTVRDVYLNPNYLIDQDFIGGVGSLRYGVFWYGDIQLKGRPVDRIVSVRSRPSSNIPIAPTTQPTLTASTTGGSIPQGTYYIGYTWLYPDESESSPVSSISTSPGNNNFITVNLPAPPTNSTGLNVYISQGDPASSTTYLANANPLNITSINIYSLPGAGQPIPPVYELTYQVRNLSDGRIWIPDFYKNDYVWVSYTTLGNVPADIREIASQITAYWISRTGTGGITMANTGPIRSYMMGNDIQVQFATAQGRTTVSLPGIPENVMPLLLRRKRNIIA